jgi:hypothetical protein
MSVVTQLYFKMLKKLHASALFWVSHHQVETRKSRKYRRIHIAYI